MKKFEIWNLKQGFRESKATNIRNNYFLVLMPSYVFFYHASLVAVLKSERRIKTSTRGNIWRYYRVLIHDMKPSWCSISRRKCQYIEWPHYEKIMVKTTPRL